MSGPEWPLNPIIRQSFAVHQPIPISSTAMVPGRRHYRLKGDCDHPQAEEMLLRTPIVGFSTVRRLARRRSLRPLGRRSSSESLKSSRLPLQQRSGDALMPQPRVGSPIRAHRTDSGRRIPGLEPPLCHIIKTSTGTRQSAPASPFPVSLTSLPQVPVCLAGRTFTRSGLMPLTLPPRPSTRGGNNAGLARPWDGENGSNGSLVAVVDSCLKRRGRRRWCSGLVFGWHLQIFSG